MWKKPSLKPGDDLLPNDRTDQAPLTREKESRERMHTLLSVALLFILTSMISGCASSKSQVKPPPQLTSPTEDLPDSFKVLTWNVWHGLATGEWWASLAESPEQDEARLHLQVRQIAEHDPDVVLLQEVNPLPARAEAYIRALKEQGLNYTEIHQVDNCGIRLSRKRALLSDLNNGLAILAKEGLQLNKIAGLKLSGDLGRCTSTSGGQLEELRYGLIGEITIPSTSVKYLVATTHLHSGFEAGEAFLGRMAEFHAQEKFTRFPWLKWEIEKARLRRIGEINTLLRELYKLNRPSTYAGMVVGGDFNCEEGFPECQDVRMLRFADTYTLAASKDELFTADPIRNRRINPDQSPEIPKSLFKEISGEPPGIQQDILAAYRAETTRPRRIDYIFVTSFFPDHCLHQELFGFTPNAEGLPASDHYGVLNIYSRDTTPCSSTSPP